MLLIHCALYCLGLAALVGSPALGMETSHALHPGVHFVEVDKIVVDSSFPLLFQIEHPITIQAPKIVAFTPISPAEKAHQTGYALFANISALSTKLDRDLNFAIQFESQTLRDRRGLHWLGSVFNWCCDLALIDTYQDGGETHARLKSLNEELKQNFQTINANNEKINRFSNSVTDHVNQLTNKMNQLVDFVKTNTPTLSFVYTTFIDLYRLIIHAQIFDLNTIHFDFSRSLDEVCTSGRLDPAIVPRDTLRSRLANLSATLSSHDVVLSIPILHLNLYYRESLVQCTRHATETTLTLKVPLTRAKTLWKAFKIIAYPFALQTKTCRVELPDFVAQGTRPGELNMYRAISFPTPRIALTTRYEIEAQVNSCLFSLFGPQTTLALLKQTCPLKCVDSQKTVITKLENDIFTITHPAAPLVLSCPTEKHTIEITKATTALRITVPCQCTLQAGSLTLIHSTFPCFLSNTSLEVTHLIPHQWSNIPDTIFLHQINTVANITPFVQLPNDLISINLQNTNLTTFDWSDVHTISVQTFSYISPLLLALILYILYRHPYLLFAQRTAQPPSPAPVTDLTLAQRAPTPYSYP